MTNKTERPTTKPVEFELGDVEKLEKHLTNEFNIVKSDMSGYCPRKEWHELKLRAEDLAVKYLQVQQLKGANG